jgi:phosphotransferase system HPr (HPr) family protein
MTKEGRTVSADNVLDLMTLSAENGTVLELEARGDSAQQVVEEIVQLFANCFEEKEPSGG